ncbi:portal protein [Caudoviricetes sp.]|nr:portal protein [Caudoviricetes sp.]
MNPAMPVIDQPVAEATPLYLPISDDLLLRIMDDAEKRGNKQRAHLKIAERSKNNVEYWKGNQVDNARLDNRFQMAHVDNVSHQNLENQIKLASGKVPDIFVAPPDKEDFNLENARDLQEFIRTRIDSNTIKRIIKNGLRDMNLKLLGVIKPRWDYQRNDFCFELVNPDDMVFAEGSKIIEDGFTIDGTEVSFQYVEEPTQVVLAKFPKKAEELKSILSVAGKEMPSRIKYTEAQFRWFDEKGRMNEGVAWRYGTVVLDSMKQPYYDYDNPRNNYFDRPRKTYILLSYLNLGESIYETTTVFEQGMPMNRMINKRRRQITEIADRAIPKLVFNGKAMNKEQATNISPSPNEGILLNKIDDIRKSFTFIPATPPNPVLFNDLLDMRDRMNSMYNTQGTSNAAESATASGISKQLSREADLVTSDDIVDIVVERAVTEMASWCMQFMRLFYDDDRDPLRVTNNEGETDFVEMTRQKIETDVQVVVKASTADKTTRRADAIQMLTAKIIDPYTLMEDLEVPNPKERTKRLLGFMESQQTQDWTRYLKIVGVSLDDQRADEQDAQRDIEAVVNGQQIQVKKPSEGYVSTFMAFVNSPEFEQLNPEQKQFIQQFVQKLKQSVEQEIAAKQQDGSVPPAMQGNMPPAGYSPDSATYTPEFGGQPPQPQQNVLMQALKSRVQYPVTTATQPGVTT